MNISSKLLRGRWEWGGSVAYLVFKANQDFVAANEEFVKQGVYRKAICAVVGVDVTLPLVANIPTTTDSPSDPDATWDAWLEDSGHTKKLDYVSGFKLNHVETSPVDWKDIFIFNNPPGFIAGPQYGISYDQAVLLINQRVAQISGDTVATGIGTLSVGVPVTILSPVVAADSPIEGIPRGGSDITGKLHVSNIVAGISFDVYSDNPSDNGNFTWVIRP